MGIRGVTRRMEDPRVASKNMIHLILLFGVRTPFASPSYINQPVNASHA